VPYAGHVNPGPEMFEILGGVEYGTTGGHTHPELDTFPEIGKDISNVVFYYDRGTGAASGYDFTARMEGYPGGDVALFDKDDLDEYVWFADAYIKREASGLDKEARLIGVSAKAGNEIHVTRLTTTWFEPIDTKKDKGTVDHTVTFNSFYSEVIAQFSSCLDYGPSDFQHTGLPSESWYAQVPHFMYWPIDWQTMDWGWCPEDDSAIRYASNDEAALHAFIDSLRLHDGSGTHHGLKWGLALLDPSSNDEFLTLSQLGLVPVGFTDRPALWTDETTQKYIVLMSEGVVATEWRPENPLDPANATIALQDQWDTPSEVHTSGATNVESFFALCDAAKGQDVEIFAIAFEAGATGKQQLLDCASSPSHFFDVDGADLTSVFGNVGGQLTQLRLTK